MLRSRLTVVASMLLAGTICTSKSDGQILEFKFNGTGTTSTSTGTSPTVVTFYDITESEADLHSAAGLGVAGDIAGHPDFGTDRAFDNTATLGQAQSPGGIAVNLTDTSVAELDSWTVTGWYKSENEPVGGGGTVLFQSPPRFTPNTPEDNAMFQGEHGIGFEGFAVRGATANGFRTTVNGSNIALGDAAEWPDVNTWVFFAVTYDGTGAVGNLNYYRGYRNASESGANPVETTLTAFGTHLLGSTLYAEGIAMGNRVDDFSRAFDGWLDNMRVFGSRDGGDGALSIEQVEALRAYDMAIEHIAGDYNSDGIVDTSDYGLWKASFGATDYLRPDGNGDGVVNIADYNVWRDNRGTTVATIGDVAAVPEPGTLLLGGLLPACLMIQVRGARRLVWTSRSEKGRT